MRQATLSIIGGVTAGLLGAAPLYAAEDELWLCRGQDGSEVYSNRQAAPDCKTYEPAARLAVRSDSGEAPSAYRKPVASSYVPPPATETRHPPEKRKPGEIDFEKFRMLSTGMTQAEILTRAGSPTYIFPFGRNIQRWVYTKEDWLIEITFTGGRVANIDSYRPRP